MATIGRDSIVPISGHQRPLAVRGLALRLALALALHLSPWLPRHRRGLQVTAWPWGTIVPISVYQRPLAVRGLALGLALALALHLSP